MSACLSLGLNPYSEIIETEQLSIALIGPDELTRGVLANVLDEIQQADVSEFISYPPERRYLRKLREQAFDLIIVELDSDPEFALELVEEVAANRATRVIVYSESTDVALASRCIRSGACDYLFLPLDKHSVTEALRRNLPGFQQDVISGKKSVQAAPAALEVVSEAFDSAAAAQASETLSSEFSDRDISSAPVRLDAGQIEEPSLAGSNRAGLAEDRGQAEQQSLLEAVPAPASQMPPIQASKLSEEVLPAKPEIVTEVGSATNDIPAQEMKPQETPHQPSTIVLPSDRVQRRPLQIRQLSDAEMQEIDSALIESFRTAFGGVKRKTVSTRIWEKVTACFAH